MFEPVDENKWTDLTGLTDEIICEYRVCFIVLESRELALAPNMFASFIFFKLWNVYFLFFYFFPIITFLYKSIVLTLINIVENNSCFNIFLIRIIISSYILFFFKQDRIV